MFTHSNFKVALSFTIIGSTAATASKFIKQCQKAKNTNFIFEKIDQLALSLECKSKIAVVYKFCSFQEMSDKTIGRRNQSKVKKINILEKDTKRNREKLQGTLSCLAFSFATF